MILSKISRVLDVGPVPLDNYFQVMVWKFKVLYSRITPTRYDRFPWDIKRWFINFGNKVKFIQISILICKMLKFFLTVKKPFILKLWNIIFILNNLSNGIKVRVFFLKKKKKKKKGLENNTCVVLISIITTFLNQGILELT